MSKFCSPHRYKVAKTRQQLSARLLDNKWGRIKTNIILDVSG